MIRVLVGSTRPAKVAGTREALEAVARIDSRFVEFVLEPRDLTAISPRMPMTLEEIIDGARTRARALIDDNASNRETSEPRTSEPRTAEPRPAEPRPAEPRNSGTEELRLAIGLEGGLHRLPIATGEWSLQSWAAVSDGPRWGYGAGPSLVLPPAIAERVVAGEELGDVIDTLAGSRVRGTRGAWGVLTRDLIGRQEAFRHAVIAALAPFYNPLT